MVRALIAALVILILSLIMRRTLSEIQVSVPRQVISVINGTSGNLRAAALRGMERRRGEGGGVSQEPVLCGREGDGFTSGQGFRGSSVFLQTRELSMKHPTNSTRPLTFQQVIAASLARLHVDLSLPFTHVLGVSGSLPHFFPFSTFLAFIVVFPDSRELFSNITELRFFFFFFLQP